MLILTKSMLSMMIGFILSVVSGVLLIPVLRKLKADQRVSIYLEEAHKKKNGTPTMGGIIFIFPTILTIFLLYLMNKIELSYSLFIVLFSFLGYGLIGFIDDYLIVKRHNNKGLTEGEKMIMQLVIAVIFFYLFMKSGNEPLLWIHTIGLKIDIGWIYGIFILFILAASSNAVNLTDGLDGLAGGLSAIALLAFGLISWNTGWLAGYEELAILCFTLIGSLLGFLIFNVNPAKVFMGDTGSLALGGTLASIAIITNHEITLIIVAGVFVIETLACIVQIASIKLFHRKVFLMAPLHHHFEKLGWPEQDIVKTFWCVGLILSMAAIAFGVWL